MASLLLYILQHDDSASCDHESIFRINLFCIVNQPPPSVLHGFATPSFLWIPLNLVPGRFQVPVESRGSGPSLTPLLCLLYLASGHCLRVRVPVSPPHARQFKYLYTPPRRSHLPLWIRLCIQVISVAQIGEPTSRGDSLFVGYAIRRVSRVPVALQHGSKKDRDQGDQG